MSAQALAKCTFSISTKDSGFLVQTANEKELNEWLYAINPLLAGQIRCVHQRTHYMVLNQFCRLSAPTCLLTVIPLRIEWLIQYVTVLTN